MDTQTGTLKITGLRDETLKALAAKEKDSGQTPEEYVRELLEDEISSAPITDVPSSQTDEARKKAAEAWRREWEALAEEISKKWQGEKGAVETLLEMRR
jgi:hypothetical protein